MDHNNRFVGEGGKEQSKQRKKRNKGGEKGRGEAKGGNENKTKMERGQRCRAIP